jgi:hypothetical protein
MSKIIRQAILIATAVALMAPVSAQAQANPPGALPWGSGLSVMMSPCGTYRYDASYKIVYAYGGAYLHDDFKRIFGTSGYALESSETRCLANGYTLRVRVWIADGWRRVGCKYWGDLIHGQISSQIVREWCGGI